MFLQIFQVVPIPNPRFCAGKIAGLHFLRLANLDADGIGRGLGGSLGLLRLRRRRGLYGFDRVRRLGPDRRKIDCWSGAEGERSISRRVAK